jgi:hypothetical protein
MKYLKVSMNRKSKYCGIKFPGSDTREFDGKIYLLHMLHRSYMSIFWHINYWETSIISSNFNTPVTLPV